LPAAVELGLAEAMGHERLHDAPVAQAQEETNDALHALGHTKLGHVGLSFSLVEWIGPPSWVGVSWMCPLCRPAPSAVASAPRKNVRAPPGACAFVAFAAASRPAARPAPCEPLEPRRERPNAPPPWACAPSHGMCSSPHSVWLGSGH